MFGKKINTDMIVPTSKITLKMSCLKACDNDIDKASKLYSFIASDLGELPDTDPVQLSGFEKVRKSADDIFSWIDSNQGRIMQGIDMIRGFRKNTALPSVPPFPDKV